MDTLFLKHVYWKICIYILYIYTHICQYHVHIIYIYIYYSIYTNFQQDIAVARKMQIGWLFFFLITWLLKMQILKGQSISVVDLWLGCSEVIGTPYHLSLWRPLVCVFWSWPLWDVTILMRLWSAWLAMCGRGYPGAGTKQTTAGFDFFCWGKKQ